MTGFDPARRPTPLPGWITGPLSRVYGGELARRNRRFDRGVVVTRLPVPVVSVGNLSAGGTGKTPFVRWAVAALQTMGRSPAVAMRGYQARPGEMSDEEREHREAMPGVPVVAQPDRAAGVRALLASEAGRGVDCVVLDDGFQHRRLARDVDIVLVDASRPPDRDALLPRGFLREGLRALGRAHGVVLTHAEMIDEKELARIAGVLRPWLPEGAPVAVTEHAWTGLHRAADREDLGVAWLAGRPVVAACAIGHPGGFLAGLKRAGAVVRASLVLRDHDPYAPATLARLERMIADVRPDALVITAKDLTKLGGWIPHAACPVLVPRLGLRWRVGDGQTGEVAIRGLISRGVRADDHPV